ncbi:peptidase M50 [Xylanimonas cellulosilytica DSM 15894]|uniref:Peptidase M50 n=1 Tax=Xylanimonas cellulosilytica (strain DSM 15894 / JCM 12276 / CECT 5975 / KCTC 9989 / LMG 20990 / NBRC 107835 / XIL07) TaxID=446471 RepID=D1C043_XYLCX|nr:site-2 protease family protein [Xylanimonas cellulosilytica]ACZ30232.1 peptidase M50 [Xylanimonas cellulosilytica DSM 15894]
MSIIVGILVVVIGVAVSIALHELGHMVPAKKFGVRVSQYMIGFGPTLWSKKKGETEYGVKAFPLGGFVRMVGMMPPAPAGTRQGRGFFSQVIADARDQSVEEIRPGEEHRAFYHLSTPKKLVVMLGGPVMNLFLAVVLTASFFAIGFTQQTTTVAALSECVPTATGEACDPATAPAPAVAAGLAPGDRIVSYDGQSTSTWRDLLEAIDGTAGREVAVVVERDGQQVPLTVTPVDVERAVVDADGAVVRDADGDAQTVAGAFVGISPTLARQSLPLGDVPAEVGRMFTGTAGAVVTFPVKVWQAAEQTFTDTPRTGDGVMSVIGVGQTAADVAGLDASILDRVAIMLSLLAALNMALFVFNLIPLLPLDGGHAVNALYEGAKRQVARVRGLHQLPGPADVARMMPVAYVMFVVLLGSGVLLMVADVVNPVRIF